MCIQQYQQLVHRPCTQCIQQFNLTAHTSYHLLHGHILLRELRLQLIVPACRELVDRKQTVAKRRHTCSSTHHAAVPQPIFHAKPTLPAKKINTKQTWLQG